jgi:hypothetical protein
MKKIILLSFCLCALLTTSMAQSYQGRNMDFLTDEKYFKLELDYSLVSNNLAFKTDEEIQEWESGQSLKELTDECFLRMLRSALHASYQRTRRAGNQWSTRCRAELHAPYGRGLRQID